MIPHSLIPGELIQEMRVLEKSCYRKNRFYGWALCVLIPTATAFCHPSGSSITSIYLIAPDSIRVALNVNHDDLMNVIGFSSGIQYDKQVTAPQAQMMQAQARDYFLERVLFKVDGQPLEGLRVISWKLGGKGPDDGFAGDSSAFWRSNFDITLGGVLPKTRHVLNVSVQLFAEYEVNSISKVSLYWNNVLLAQHWVGVDRTLKFPASIDSLNAMAARVHTTP